MRRRIQNKEEEKNVPRRVWDFLAEHQSQTMSFIPQGPSDRTGYELVTGQTPDTSDFLDFDFMTLFGIMLNSMLAQAPQIAN